MEIHTIQIRTNQGLITVYQTHLHWDDPCAEPGRLKPLVSCTGCCGLIPLGSTGIPG